MPRPKIAIVDDVVDDQTREFLAESERYEAIAKAKHERDYEVSLDAWHRMERFLKSGRFPELPADGNFRDPFHTADVAMRIIYRCHGSDSGSCPNPEAFK